MQKNKYKLDDHPFKVKFTEKEIDILNYIRDKIYLLNNIELIIKTNKLVERHNFKNEQ